MSRTNIDIDDDLMAAAMKASGKTTKKAAVEDALRRLVRAAAFRELVEGMRGIGWDDGLGKNARRLELAEGSELFDPPAPKK